MNTPDNPDQDLERWYINEEFKQDHQTEWRDQQRQRFEDMDRYDESGYWRHFR